ncbi:MAG: c-type cytochrome [Deltaproteobacteria bacterium]|nr:c-type cytochrome [Nannocystaceae bacterium]
MTKALFSLIALSSILIGCDEQKPAGNPEAVAAAQQLWDTKCSTCHGKEGRGDGEAGLVLNPRPRNFENSMWQSQADDAKLKKTIIEGGAAVGLSANMSANPELADKPEVVDELVKKIRSFKP